MTKRTEIEKMAYDLLTEEAWFRNLPDSAKDELSQPNHDHNQAQRGLDLARLIVAGGNDR